MDRLDALRAFVRLCERGSFTDVARELGVGQSTVSKWMASLEEELGQRLIDRTTRAQRITEAGERFYGEARAVVQRYDEAVAELQRAAPTLSGRIRLSLPVVLGTKALVPMIGSFLRKHPSVEAQLVFSDRYVSPVDEGFDVNVRVGELDDSSMVAHRLGQSPRRLLASAGYLKKHGTPMHPRDLADHACLVHTGRPGRAIWELVRGEQAFRISVRGQVLATNSEATMMLAKDGLGICLLAGWLVDPEVRQGRLKRLLPGYEPRPAPIHALTPPGRYVPPAVRALIEHLRAGLADHEGIGS